MKLPIGVHDPLDLTRVKTWSCYDRCCFRAGDYRVLRDQRPLYLCLRETVNHGKHTCCSGSDWTADLPGYRFDSTRDLLVRNRRTGPGGGPEAGPESYRAPLRRLQYSCDGVTMLEGVAGVFVAYLRFKARWLPRDGAPCDRLVANVSETPAIVPVA